MSHITLDILSFFFHLELPLLNNIIKSWLFLMLTYSRLLPPPSKKKVEASNKQTNQKSLVRFPGNMSVPYVVHLSIFTDMFIISISHLSQSCAIITFLSSVRGGVRNLFSFDFKEVQHPWTLFLKTLYIFSKYKQLWTKYPMDLVRNVPRNSKTTVLLQ